MRAGCDLASVLTDAGHKVVSTDLVEYGFGISGVDFLTKSCVRAPSTSSPIRPWIGIGRCLR